MNGHGHQASSRVEVSFIPAFVRACVATDRLRMALLTDTVHASFGATDLDGMKSFASW